MNSKSLTIIVVSIISTTLSKDFNLHIYTGSQWNHSFKMGIIRVHTTPQFAVWIEDTLGNYIETIKVTKKSAKSKFIGAKESRPSALPVWSHKRDTINSYNNYMPSKETKLVDAVTAASPKGDSTILFTVDDSIIDKGVRLFFEINQSMDYNDYYRENSKEDDANGQPSLIYSATFKSSDAKTNQSISLIGIGTPTGEISKSTNNLTTALKIVGKISVEW